MYDVTVVYPGAKGDDCPQDERDLLEDKFPEKIHFHIRRFQEWGFSSFCAEEALFRRGRLLNSENNCIGRLESSKNVPMCVNLTLCNCELETHNY